MKYLFPLLYQILQVHFPHPNPESLFFLQVQKLEFLYLLIIHHQLVFQIQESLFHQKFPLKVFHFLQEIPVLWFPFFRILSFQVLQYYSFQNYLYSFYFHFLRQSVRQSFHHPLLIYLLHFLILIAILRRSLTPPTNFFYYFDQFFFFIRIGFINKINKFLVSNHSIYTIIIQFTKLIIRHCMPHP